MTQENKELLLKDLCARLPYGVKIELAKRLCSKYAQKLYNPSNTGKNEQKLT